MKLRTQLTKELLERVLVKQYREESNRPQAAAVGAGDKQDVAASSVVSRNMQLDKTSFTTTAAT